MKKFNLVAILFTIGCGIHLPPNPNPTPTPTPIPTPTPPPGHICVVDKEFCNCYIMIPGSNTWTLTSCPEGQECTSDYQCKTPTPPLTCETTSCPDNFHCEELGGKPVCVKDIVIPPIPTEFCPKKLAPGAKVTLNNHKYGNGETCTPWVEGDIEFCQAIHGPNAGPNCHLEGWPFRAQCEMELMKGCPVWEYRLADGSGHICSDDHDTAPISCDHYGDPIDRDDPATKTTGDTIQTLVGFEGKPLECGLQRDSFGPIAGFFTIGHGNGFVRACLPDHSYCADWIAFNF